MTPEELDEARAKEARRLWMTDPEVFARSHPATIAARLARENWTPPEPVDPDLLAFREWFADLPGSRHPRGILAGHWDTTSHAIAYLAGARMAREQERERAKELVELAKKWALFDSEATHVINKYWGEA